MTIPDDLRGLAAYTDQRIPEDSSFVPGPADAETRAAFVERLRAAAPRVIEAPTYTYRQPARLQSMTLPNGRFLLVLDRYDGEALSEEEASRFREQSGAAAVVAFAESVDVVQADDLAQAAAEACALTHGDEDGALAAKLREAYAADTARREAWRAERGTVLSDVRALLAVLDEPSYVLPVDIRDAVATLRSTLAGVAA